MSENQTHETNSGVVFRGNKEGVVEFSKRLKDIMNDLGLDEESVQRFEEWRPREEDKNPDLERKTAKGASMKETKVEEESDGFNNDMKEAGGNIKKAANGVIGDEDEDPGKNLVEATYGFFRPFVFYLFKLIRKMEELIYSDFMLKFNSYYFSEEDISLRLKEQNGTFTMYLESPLEQHRKILKERLVRKN